VEMGMKGTSGGGLSGSGVVVGGVVVDVVVEVVVVVGIGAEVVTTNGNVSSELDLGRGDDMGVVDNVVIKAKGDSRTGITSSS
jgi:hypothetical protein